MKRRGYLIEQISDIENLRLAYLKARRGKSDRKEVLAFSSNLQTNLTKMSGDIVSGNVHIGDYHYFTIFDPKERVICAAPFPQRVLHHAIMNICHDDFERFQTDDSYASRPGRGTYAALSKAFECHDRFSYCLKLDIRKYFDSISHEILKRQLSRLFRDECLLSIFSKIIDSYSVSIEKGLPIGNLTSQYMANHYLSVADHYVRERLGAKAYVRYMDDMIVWDNSVSRLRNIGIEYRNFLENELKLSLKVFDLSPSVRYTTFLGYRMKKHVRGLSKRSAVRYRNMLMENYRKFDEGIISQDEFSLHLRSALSFVEKVDSSHFRQKVMATI